MNINTNAKTGVPFGYISANSLHPDVVHDLMYGAQAVDLTLQEFERELELELREQLECEDEIESRFEDALMGYQCDEPRIEGTYEGVTYVSSWLGGALQFFILESPVVAHCAQCSPCVPGAGDLDTAGDYACYGVPDDWRA